MHKLIFDKEAVDYLDCLSKELKERIFKKILAAKSNPYHFFERLSARKDYKLRIGEYRVIADIDDKSIQVTHIGHRKNVYDKIQY